jgi:hypothetical protein
MTEAEWRTCKDVGKMLQCLKTQHRATMSKGGRRKLRLFVCGCCRQAWSLLQNDSRRALECAEAYADGVVGKDALKRAERASQTALTAAATGSYLPWSATRGVREATKANVSSALTALSWAWGALVRNDRTPGIVLQPQGKLAEASQRDLLRDITGNPFRPVPRDSLRLTSAVMQLAASIYHEHAFDRMPILADALEESGCTDARILKHCRGPGPHVRGCWVVDLLLGKE